MMLHPPAVDESFAVETLCNVASDPSRAKALHDAIGEFCHLVRNRLNSLQIGLYLAKSQSPTTCAAVWDELASHYRDAERRIELLQIVCRPMRVRPIRIGLDLILQEFVNRWEPRFAASKIVMAPPSLAIDEPSRVDLTHMSEGLESLAAWRLSHAKPGSRIQLHARAMQGWSRLEWSEPVATDGARRGGLPMGVCARVASAHGGSLTREVRNGLRIMIEWPNRDPSGTP